MIWRFKLLYHQVGSRFCKGWKGLGVAGKLLVKKKKKNSLQVRTCGGRDIDMRSRPGLVKREVATRNGRRDLAGLATGLEALRAA